jgi:ankyrin repeat protein
MQPCIYLLQNGRTLLHVASYNGNKEIVEILLDSGAVVDKGDKVYNVLLIIITQPTHMHAQGICTTV